MADEQPWQLGDYDQRWAGYLDERHFDPDIGDHVLRNLVGAETFAELRLLEDLRVEARALTMGDLGIPHSYDLAGLQEIHRHLFQDVYPWAGEIRTVNMGKAGQGFAPVEGIEQVLSIVRDDMINGSNQLRDLPDEAVPRAFAMIYHGVNYAHPFREGNGRTQRHFLGALAAESGHQLDWTAVSGFVNDRASREARAGNMDPLFEMFEQITSETPGPTPQETQRARWRDFTQGYRAAQDHDHDRGRERDGYGNPGRDFIRE